MFIIFLANSVPLIDLIVEHIVLLDIVDQRMPYIHTVALATKQDMVLALGVA